MAPPDDYSGRLARLHRELGIPSDYAVRRALPVQFEADESELTTIAEKPDGTPIRLRAPAAEAWRRLHAAAVVAGITLEPLSGFRSVNRKPN